MNQIQFNQSIPNTDSESFKAYYKEIQKYPVLTQEEEAGYLRQVAGSSNQQAIDKLMKHNLRLVVYVAKQYQTYDSLEDLVQEGNIGLYKAIIGYNDPSYSIKFNTFAVKKIQGEILDYLRKNNRGVAIPTNKNSLVNKINKFINRFEVENQFEPTDEMICAEFKITKEQLDDVKGILNLIFETELNNDEDSPLSSIAEDPSEYSEYSEFILKIQSILTEKEFAILMDSFGINTPELDIDEIASKYSISADRTRFIKNNAIIKLRKYPELINYLTGEES